MKANHIWLAGFLSVLIASPAAPAAVVTLPASMDNTLFEDPTGALSGGASPSIFTGRLGSSGGELLRRIAVAFDLSTIPANAVIDNVTLTITLSKGNGGPTPIQLHRFTKPWGEGASFGGQQGAPSTAGSATWIHNSFNTSTWTTPGGDFDPAVSAVQNANISGVINWSSAAMRVEVQNWINNPATNFGWILIGNETDPSTAKMFNSKESGGGPTLTVTYTVPEPATLALLTVPLTFLSRTRRPSGIS